MNWKLIFLIFAVSMGSLACDGCKEQKADPFDAAWSRVQPLVMNASTDDERIRILKNFISEHEGHAGLGPMQKQLDALEAQQNTAPPKAEEKPRLSEEEKMENAKERYAAIQEGKLDGLVDFVVTTTIMRGGGSQNISTIDTVRITDITGEERDFDGSKNFLELTVRNALLQKLRWVDAEKFDKKCRSECLNAFLNTFLTPIAGGPIYKEKGYLSKEPVDKVLAAIEITSDTEFGGATVGELYRLSKPAFEQSLAVREAIRKQGDDQVLTAFRIAKKEGSRKLQKWYKAYPVETGITETLPEGQRRRVDQSLGFWIRRINDGTADSFENFLKNVKKTATEK